MSSLSSGGGFRSRSKRQGSASARPQRPRPTSGKAPQKTQNSPRREHHRSRESTAPHAGQRSQDARWSFTGIDAAREVAFTTLVKVRENDAYANLILPKALRQRGITGRDAAFATEITYGTLRTLGVLDAVIGECSSRPLERIVPEVLDALRLGTYQLMYTRVEPHAAVDTSVRLVEATGNIKAKGFANGILRTISRSTPEQWLERLTPQGEIAAAAFKHAHPEWIARSFSRSVGVGELSAALDADSQRPIVHLVARPGEISAEELALITGGEEGSYSPYAVYLESGNPADIEPVAQGLAGVQDEGSQLIARALAEVPVDDDRGKWLDLCAGPGGKAALVGSLARIDGAHVDAVEVSAHRAQLVEKAVAGLPVTTHVADGRKPDVGTDFDRVLVDAPCSGLGALRRRPEARWRKKESDIAELVVLQKELLESAIALARPGGVIVYSTCSPDLRETREVVDWAISELGVVEEDAHPYVAPMDNVGQEKSVQMWPHRHGTDAMFFAVLRKPMK
ncbi:RsmB/NOP family class I SAM-dependent RNA methyltransferase [Corynebacterium renale]|uniref:16S rRNA (Cytosine967-C5)-methyltransferase n=1 Tax=Corynebacterium renale TaxID=1724 RepID=A0A2A9DPP0_9CORY|nr:transcription antitermination factor NusB [Corynebacterium renale]PFG28658.1 16S rRNA (cytosine967-C5)-methyltransferase [Corynebacterium renale]SQI26106.1 Ribosomal RNA small subunit methyltransferase B [Corynebacterium renale]